MPDWLHNGGKAGQRRSAAAGGGKWLYNAQDRALVPVWRDRIQVFFLATWKEMEVFCLSVKVEEVNIQV